MGYNVGEVKGMNKLTDKKKDTSVKTVVIRITIIVLACIMCVLCMR